MHIQMTGRHMEITDGIRTHIDDAFKKLRFTDSIMESHATLSVEKLHRHSCELVCLGREYTVKVQEESNDMYQAIDAAFKRLETQLKKHHDEFKKRRTLNKREKQREEAEQFKA